MRARARGSESLLCARDQQRGRAATPVLRSREEPMWVFLAGVITGFWLGWVCCAMVLPLDDRQWSQEGGEDRQWSQEEWEWSQDEWDEWKGRHGKWTVATARSAASGE